MTIKKSLMFGMVLVLLAGCTMEEVSTDTYTSLFESTKSISVENTTGNLTITKWDKKYIEVKATKKAVFKEDASDVTVSITDEENYSIKTIYPDYHNGVSVDYEIKIPETINIRASITTGNIDINGGSIASDIETTTGDIKVLNTAYTGNIKSTTGNISAEIWDLTSDCTIKSTTGNIAASVKTDEYKKITSEVTTGKITNNFVSETGNGNGTYSIYLKLTTGNIDVNK